MSQSIRRTTRPVDAASLVILRGNGAQAEALMGRRRRSSSFMPGWYVFPGGRVDPLDARVPDGVALRPEVEARLRRRCHRLRANALAMAAIRETHEETGLLIGTPGAGAAVKHSAPDTPFWRACADTDVLPALDRIDYIARAITPTMSPKRFNARFFLVDADHAYGDLGGSGELVDLRWVPVENPPPDLPIADVTEFVLGEAIRTHREGADPERRVPVMCYVNQTTRILHD